ncbi:MAG: hypothetical protein JO040_05540 [Gemmatimonadetes bacterium]|nr:hypothetical protein [Gemmatimonadota bacterium]
MRIPILAYAWLIVLGVLAVWDYWDPSSGDIGPPGCIQCQLTLVAGFIAVILGVVGIVSGMRTDRAAVR